MLPAFIRTRADFDRLAKPGTFESTVIEFKREIGDWRVDGADPERDQKLRDARLEFCRDVVQFANADGGCLVIGVYENTTRDGVKAAGVTKPISARDAQELRQWMRDAIGRHASPSTFEPDSILEIDDPGGKVIVINVTPKPTMIGVWDDHERWFQVPVRRGTSVYRMNRDEMEAARMDRGRAAKLRLIQALGNSAEADVELAGTMYRRSVNQQTIQNDLIEPSRVRIRKAFDDPDVFELVISIGSKDPTIRLSYDAIRHLWIGGQGKISIVLEYPLVYQNDRLKLDVHPPRR